MAHDVCERGVGSLQQQMACAGAAAQRQRCSAGPAQTRPSGKPPYCGPCSSCRPMHAKAAGTCTPRARPAVRGRPYRGCRPGCWFVGFGLTATHATTAIVAPKITATVPLQAKGPLQATVAVILGVVMAVVDRHGARTSQSGPPRATGTAKGRAGLSSPCSLQRCICLREAQQRFQERRKEQQKAVGGRGGQPAAGARRQHPWPPAGPLGRPTDSLNRSLTLDCLSWGGPGLLGHCRLQLVTFCRGQFRNHKRALLHG